MWKKMARLYKGPTIYIKKVELEKVDAKTDGNDPEQ